MVAKIGMPKITQVVSKDGECHVTVSLELSINLNVDGLQISAQSNDLPKKKQEEESTDWAIPDFSSGPKLQFGKQVKE